MTACALVGACVATVGCGQGRYENRPRPPAPINITASVSSRAVAVSPDRVGAGPIVVIVTNQTASSQEVILESGRGAATGGGEVAQTTEPIASRATGQLMVDAGPGSYRLRTGRADIEPATITVGPRRQSAQNQLLQP